MGVYPLIFLQILLYTYVTVRVSVCVCLCMCMIIIVCVRMRMYTNVKCVFECHLSGLLLLFVFVLVLPF